MTVYIRRSSPSESLNALKLGIINAGVNCILSRRNDFSGTSGLVLNYGTVDDPIRTDDLGVSNLAPYRRMARNKALSLAAMEAAGVSVPGWFTRKEDVVRGANEIIVERHSLTGSGGEGIRIVRPGEELDVAPLYTQYIRKSHEYRVHVVFGETVAVQQKRRRDGAEMTNDQMLIRNHENGWVFCIEDIDPLDKDALSLLARRAVSAHRLNSGAVDIVKQNRTGRFFVLEVNTCPGLSSPTVLGAYVNKIVEVHNSCIRR